VILKVLSSITWLYAHKHILYILYNMTCLLKRFCCIYAETNETNSVYIHNDKDIPTPKPINPKDEFKNYDLSTPSFSLSGQTGFCRLVDVYDGDTIKVIFPFSGKKYKFIVRLQGIDTCEMTSKDVNIKQKAIEARNKVLELAYGHKVADYNTTRKYVQEMLKKDVIILWIRCLEFDKYGRLLADVHSNDGQPSFSEVLLKYNLAYRYQGAKKLTVDEQLKTFT
jgi:endonuclease YncB( thermonuclease family)